MVQNLKIAQKMEPLFDVFFICVSFVFVMHTVKSQILNIYFWNPFAYCLMRLWNQRAYMDNMFIVNICDLLKSANLQWNILIHIFCSFEIRRPNEFFVYPFVFICQEYEKIIQFWKWIVIYVGEHQLGHQLQDFPWKRPKKIRVFFPNMFANVNDMALLKLISTIITDPRTPHLHGNNLSGQETPNSVRVKSKGKKKTR